MENIGLIFDMDGVIVDNHEYHYLAWQKTAKKHNSPVAINDQFYREKMNGRTLAKLVEVVFPGREMTIESAERIGLEKEEIYRELYKESLTPTPGLLDFLALAKSKGIPMVVGTSAPVENVTFTLDGLDLRKYFVGIVDASMVAHGKPDPEVYLKCAAMIHRDPRNCIVFEDAPLGMEAGRNAGAEIVALATSHTRDELSAKLILDDFTQLEWEQIVTLISKPEL